MSAGIYAAVLAAGSSSRMGEDKLSMRLGGGDAIALSVEAFFRCAHSIDGVVIAASAANMERAGRIAASHANVTVIEGGASRGESAHRAILAVNALCGGGEAVVAIHDAARCLVEAATIDAAIEGALRQGSGVACIPVRDTLRYENGVQVARDGLFAMQTPQCFRLDEILAAYELSAKNGYRETDDCAVYMAAGREANFTPGSIANQKLTYRGDLGLFNAMTGIIRIGMGEDTHALAFGRKLILGGVDIPFDKGLMGHSDADVLTHAVIDALLGAAALGDIGRHFPDSDPRYKGICSLELLRSARVLLADAGFAPCNIDSTVTAQRPKLAPYIDKMRLNIARCLGMDAGMVSVKATTTEGMNAEGRGECITARAVCTVHKL